MVRRLSGVMSFFASIRKRSSCLYSVLLLGILFQVGCRSLDIDTARRIASLTSKSAAKLRKTPRNPLAAQINLAARSGPRPTERTQQFLRRFDLTQLHDEDPVQALRTLIEMVTTDPTLETTYVIAELAYIEGERTKSTGSASEHSRLFATALIHAYQYLFDERFSEVRNAYDPEFRRACDIYNKSLEDLLRKLKEQKQLQVGGSQSIDTLNRSIQFTIEKEPRWNAGEIDGFEFVSDYETIGLTNLYHTYGLGVPLIARHAPQPDDAAEPFYPQGLSFPVTAFFRVNRPKVQTASTRPVEKFTLQLCNPLQKTLIEVDGLAAPLESDITTPLAYFLNDPLVNSRVLPTAALLNADLFEDYRGLYMLEPYDPNRIPVVMVHGFWSSPATWTEMFNDLRAMREIRKHYQFWFYMYPTGQPIWNTAKQMRDDLDELFDRLDPHRESTAMQQMVIVGHSMGGLVSHLQTLESGSRFWNLVSDSNFDNLKGTDEDIRNLHDTFFFGPNPAVKRVITIATPHRGSRFSNIATNWLSQQLFQLPQQLLQQTETIVRENPEVFGEAKMFKIRTSVDSMSPDSPFINAMLHAPRAPWVKHHNIVGRVERAEWLTRKTTKFVGDGVVSLSSASVATAQSEIEVAADHSNVHRHPRTILEVRRVLLEHLKSLGRDPGRPLELPAYYQTRAGDVPFGQGPQRWASGLGTDEPMSDPRAIIR